MWWPFSSRSTPQRAPAQIYLSNTLSGNKELFVPLKAGAVSMYSCGPTVYSRAQIGNLRAYVFADTLARTLREAGFHLRRVINITDVGHLVGDADAGEDKMSVAASLEKKSPTDIAEAYTRQFIDDLDALNIDTDSILFPRATDYIKEQIAMAKTLEEKGFAYRLPDGLYFDTTKFVGYGRLGNVGSAELRSGARVAPVKGKRHPSDFALWRVAKPGDLQQWDSPWGRGNPGWHIECSAMIRTLLGIEIDIHTGGMDHIQVHHNNEIAQSEAANGRPFVRYWLHEAFLTLDGHKISKSLKNDIYLSDLIERGYDPLALRYFLLQAHYHTPISFSWDALRAGSEALGRLTRIAEETREAAEETSEPSGATERFVSALYDDLGTPQALGVLWESLKSDEYSPEEKWGLLLAADRLLGLALTEKGVHHAELALGDLPAEVQGLVRDREAARQAKNFTLADSLRARIENGGYSVEDSPDGPILTKRAR